MLRYVILGVLCEGKPLHGFGIAQAFKKRSGHAIRSSSVYRELLRLSGQGLIRRVETRRSDPRQIPYEITQAGIDGFRTWLQHLPDSSVIDVVNDPLALRCVFTGQASNPEVTVDRWKQRLLIDGSKTQAELKELLLRGVPADSLLTLLRERRAKLIAFNIELLDRTLASRKPTDEPESATVKNGRDRRVRKVQRRGR